MSHLHPHLVPLRHALIIDLGYVGRSMHVAKREGPDLLFLANQHSRKFQDLAKNNEVQFTFAEPAGDWVSIAGTATTSNSDPRIKEIYSKPLAAWFGDLGDGKHDGGPEDPRLAIIEVKSKYATYYKKEVGTLGFAKEIGMATLTGKVAKTGVLRELSEQDLEEGRKSA